MEIFHEARYAHGTASFDIAIEEHETGYRCKATFERGEPLRSFANTAAAAFTILTNDIQAKRKELFPNQAASRNLQKWIEQQRIEIDMLSSDDDSPVAQAMAEADKQLARQMAKETLAEAQSEDELVLSGSTELGAVIGRAQAFAHVQDYTNIMLLRECKRVKEQKLYKADPAIGTWEAFCKLIGKSARHINDCLDNLETLGASFLQSAEQIGLSFSGMRSLSKAVQNGMMAIEGDTLIVGDVIEGEFTEVVSFDDKDRMKDTLERMIQATGELLATKNNELKAKTDALEASYKREEDANKAQQKALKELEKIKGSGSIQGMPAEDYGDFSEMEALGKAAMDLFASIGQLMSRSDDMSVTNRSYLHGLSAMALELAANTYDKATEAGLGNYELPPAEEYATTDESIIAGVKNAKGHKSSGRGAGSPSTSPTK